MTIRFSFRMLATMVLAGVLLTAGGAANDCLQTGDSVGVFYVTKVAGAVDDGVRPGEQVCYRCRYGSRPLVMVFARESGGRLPELVRRLDLAVGRHQESSLKGLVTFVGESPVEMKEQAASVAQSAAVRKVPVAIAREPKTGPENYKLRQDVAVTVVVAKDSQVVRTHTYDVDKIDVAAIMTDVQRILY